MPDGAQSRVHLPLAKRLAESGFLLRSEFVQRSPAQIGRYQVVRSIGKGGGGEVLLAVDPAMGRRVAIKVLHSGARGNMDRFQGEISVLAALKHPNIVEIYDTGTAGDRPYYVMEYAGERSLADAKLPLREAVVVLTQVAMACHAAHERGVIHRDLKPDNVLLGEDRPLVVDFGVAKILESMDIATKGRTRTGAVIGTPSYMSPEQISGQKAIDRRSDVFALGVILYELLTGQQAFPGTNLMQVAVRVVEVDPPAPSAVDPGLPEALSEITMRAIAKAPDERYPTAQDLALALGGWLKQPAQTASAAPDEGADPLEDDVHPAAKAGLVAVLVLALATVLVLSLKSGGDRELAVTAQATSVPSPTTPVPSAQPSPPSSPAPQRPPVEDLARLAELGTQLTSISTELATWAASPAPSSGPLDLSRLVTLEAQAHALGKSPHPPLRQRALITEAWAVWLQGKAPAAGELAKEALGVEGGADADAVVLKAQCLLDTYLWATLVEDAGLGETLRDRLRNALTTVLGATSPSLEALTQYLDSLVRGDPLRPGPSGARAYMEGARLLLAGDAQASRSPLKRAASTRGTAVSARALLALSHIHPAREPDPDEPGGVQNALLWACSAIELNPQNQLARRALTLVCLHLLQTPAHVVSTQVERAGSSYWKARSSAFGSDLSEDGDLLTLRATLEGLLGVARASPPSGFTPDDRPPNARLEFAGDLLVRALQEDPSFLVPLVRARLFLKVTRASRATEGKRQAAYRICAETLDEAERRAPGHPRVAQAKAVLERLLTGRRRR